MIVHHMKTLRVTSVLLGGFIAASLSAQPSNSVGPDAQEIPVPPVQTSMGTLPGVDELPIRTEMPNVLTMNDGTKVTSTNQWPKRQAEMKRILEYYAVGQMPPPPGNVKGREVKSVSVMNGMVKYQLVNLTFGPERKLNLNIGIFIPADRKGPFPAIIFHSSTPPGATPLPRLPQGPNQGKGKDVLLLVGPVPTNSMPPSAGPYVPGHEQVTDSMLADAEKDAKRHALVFQRGYALVVFNPNDCAEDTTLRNLDGSWAFRNTRFCPAYPHCDWGVLAVWAWGVSRIADYLETDRDIDGTKLIVTGASRYGKSSMIAAAFDERLMGAPVVTGGGGLGAYRFAGPRHSETLDIMVKKYPNWFSPHLHQFWGHKEKLPFDQHWFLALCAPRPFIALEGDTDTISLPDAVKHSILAAKPAYALFGATDKLGVHYSHHGHTFNEEDWTALLDFADKYLRGRKVDRTFVRFPTETELDEALKNLPRK